MSLDSETFGQLLDTVRRFVRERLVPREAEVAANDAMPADLIAEMRALGLFGLAIPEEYGGIGLNVEEEVRVAIELGKTSPAFRSTFGTNNGIGSQGIVIDGTEEQKKKYLPKLGSGELIGCFGLTEPNHGSDPGGSRPSACSPGSAPRSSPCCWARPSKPASCGRTAGCPLLRGS